MGLEIVWLLAGLSIIFFVYLLYTRQWKWLFGVVRNMGLGVAGILLVNMATGGLGITVGVNMMTATIVGLLGLPGFILLYAGQVLLNL